MHGRRTDACRQSQRVVIRKSGIRAVVVAWLLVLPGAICSPDLESWGAGRAAVLLVVPDVLTTPGKSVQLEARLIQEGLLGGMGLGGERVEFFVRGQSVGTAMSGGDGRAFLEYTTRMRGVHPVKVKTISHERIEPAEATAVLAAWEYRKPILIVDMKALLTKQSIRPLPFPLPPLALSQALEAGAEAEPDAAGELEKLTKFYFNVIYLAQSRIEDPGRLRSWLTTHGFPTGLTRVIAPGKDAFEALLEDMQTKGWENIQGGIGRTREFAEVLAKRRLEAVILPLSEQDKSFPRRAEVVSSWKEVRKFL